MLSVRFIPWAVLLSSLSLLGCQNGLIFRNQEIIKEVPVLSKQRNTKEIKGINLTNMDFSVRPQDDFFNFVNGIWVKNTKIPADKVSWGAFNELRESTDERSLAILHDLEKEQPPLDSAAQKIKTTYEAYINVRHRNELGLKPLLKEFKEIDKAENLTQLQKVMSHYGRQGQGNPFFNWQLEADMKNSADNAVYLSGGFITLPRDYYQKDTAENAAITEKYQKLIINTLECIGIKQNKKQLAKEIIALEKQMASHLLTNEQIRDANLQYNPKTVDQLKKISKNIDLPNFLEAIGVKTKRVIIDEIKYFEHLDDIWQKKNLPLLKAYYQYWLIASNRGILDQSIEKDFFDFFNAFLQGQKEQRNLEKKGQDFINDALGEAFGQLYVKRYFPESSKKVVEILIGYLQKSYHQHLEDLSWMSETTKKKALEKLDRLKIKVGYPDKWKDYSALHIDPQEKDLFEISKTITAWSYQQDLDKIGKKVDKSEWEMPPQTVNAYYNPLKHEIVFPAAILQSPFFDPEADAAVNFGGIGGVIAHEITHGFDDSGANFDANGNLNNWWQKQDKDKFDALTAQLAEQFNHYEVAPGAFINGKFTLGENIADLGGVTLALDALKLYVQDHPRPENGSSTDQRFNEIQKFFISWASVWRTKSTEQYLRHQVKIDPHSPGKIRAFAPLTNLGAFYKAFDVKKGDKLYRAPQDRVRIW